MVHEGRTSRSSASARAALLVTALGSTLGGCLLVYDYGDYQPVDSGSGTSTATGGAGGNGAGGGAGGSACAEPAVAAAEACRSCYETQCAVVLAGPCTNSATCGAWYGCIADCCDPACHRACEGGSVPAGSPIDQMYECICGKCSDECSAVVAPPGC